jgi:L-asparaginase II
MKYANCQAVIEVLRGSQVECIHEGAIAVVDAAGVLLASYGDPETVTFMRSSAKPFQALPLIERGGIENFSLTDEEIAVICSSHSGTDKHVAVINALQHKLGVNEHDLLCGTHLPMHTQTAHSLIKRNEEPTANRHNCSGKHTGMLAQALLRHVSYKNYTDLEHPVQQLILQTVAEMLDINPGNIDIGIDGCSVPTFALPLNKAAHGFARLADPSALSAERANACRRIFKAMSSNAEMVAGPGRFDSNLMVIANGAIVAKAGAEGYQAIGLTPGTLGPGSQGVGIAFKIADGDPNSRAGPIVAMEVLYQLGALSHQQLVDLDSFHARRVTNFRKMEVGEIRPCFTLVRHPIPQAK